MKAWELLSKKSCWTQRAYARKSDGESCRSEDRDAVCWCMSGALRRCAMDDGYTDGSKLARLMEKIGVPLSIWNDNPNRTHEEVVAALKEFDL